MRRISQISCSRLLLAASLFALILSGPATPSCKAQDSWTANLTAGTNADGRLEVFEVNANGDLRHRWEREPLHEWSAWSVLGGPFQPGVAVVNDETGRLGVFAVLATNNQVTYNFQNSPNNSSWSNWTELPGLAVRGPLAAGRDVDGRLEIFAVAAENGSVKHIWQDDDREGWSGWADMGGAFEPGVVLGCNKNGQLELFGLNRSDHVLTHCWQSAVGSPAEWWPWTSLEEPLLPGFAVGQNKDGRLEAIGVNTINGNVVHAWQDSPSALSPWSQWAGLGAKMRPAIALGRNRDGRLEIFTVSPSNSMIYHSFQSKGGATNWVGWTDMSLVGGLSVDVKRGPKGNQDFWGGFGGRTRSYPAVEPGAQGELDIFAFDERLEDVLNFRRQISGNLAWTDWSSLDHSASHYLSRVWRMDDGLPDNRVQAVAQTPDGYLWVGTHNGLAKFDGAHFVLCDVRAALGMTNPSITCLCVDHEGGLWVGSESEGAARIFGGQIFHYGLSNGLAGNSLTTILEARDQSLWLGTRTGLSHFRAGTFTNYTRTNGLSSDVIRAALEDSTGIVWVTTDHGVSCLTTKGITTYTLANGLPDEAVTGVWQDVPGRVWIGSDHGVILYRNHAFHAYDQSYGLSDRLASVIRTDSRGHVWVGNNSGLNQFKDGRFVEEVDQEGNSFGRINALFDDREGNLWAGSQDGLLRLSPKGLVVYGRQQQLTHNNITAVLEDARGSLWVGTWGGGLDQMKDDIVTAYGLGATFQFDLVSSLCRRRDGTLWMGGSAGSGILQLRNGALVQHVWTNNVNHSTIKVIHEDRAGNLWIGTAEGLTCLQSNALVTSSIVRELNGREVRAICETTGGTLWFGTVAGLYRCQDGAVTHFATKEGLSDLVVTALYADENQTIWIGTQNGGLNRFEEGRITSYSEEAGLFSNEIFEIVPDDFGWLWMTCSKGVFRVRKKDLDDFDQKRIPTVTSIAYGHDDGMESVLCGTGKPGGWKSRDGELWFPTAKGLVAIDPRALKINRMPPPVFIESIIVDNRPLTLRDGAGTFGGLPIQDASANPISVPPGRGELEFHYTAPSFQRPERIRFKYKLAGVDPDWVEADTRRVAYYNNLSPDHYVFRVKACNSDGIWNEADASMGIILMPHLWQTWWFRILAISAVVAMVAGTARQVTRRRMQRKLEMLEQKHAIEKERLRIAQDIHDDLGGSLTQIALLGELAIGTLPNPVQTARHLTKITNSARLNVRALDEIVWAVHPGNDTLNSVVLYLWQFAEEFFGASSVRCRVEAPDNIPAQPLSSDVRHGIFLLVKEAFNNTIKHSGATEVKLRFTVTASNFMITIEDNGHGFDIGAVNGAGNGVANMKQRVEKMAGKLALASVPGRGTRIEFVMALKNYHEVN